LISESEHFVLKVTEALDAYELQKACQPIVEFIDLLNNWYIRRSRRRFWRSENDGDKIQAYNTLYTVLMKFCLVSAPFIPFTTEEIYRNLKTGEMEESIHLCAYPKYQNNLRDLQLELKMALTKQTVTMGRALRSIHALKTRQPLQSFYIVNRDQSELDILQEMETIIMQELNVKQVEYRTKETDLVSYSAKANFKVLGRSLGKDMKEVAQLLQNISGEKIERILEGGSFDLSYSNGTITIDSEAIVVQRSEKEGMKVLNEGKLTVGIDSRITPELIREGIARDIIRSVQNLRKERNLDVTDRIALHISGPDEIQTAVQNFNDYIKQETLTEKLHETDFGNISIVSCGEIEVGLDIEAIEKI